MGFLWVAFKIQNAFIPFNNMGFLVVAFKIKNAFVFSIIQNIFNIILIYNTWFAVTSYTSIYTCN